jgi:methionine-rich copper-binding protein CopC
VKVDASLPSGRYTVGWRTAGRDGHLTSGAFTFTVDPPAHK